MENLKDLTAVLFINEYKEKDNQPDFVGSVSNRHTRKKLYKVSAWKNKSQTGTSYLSIRFTDLPEPKMKLPYPEDKTESKESDKGHGDPIDDDVDIPF